MKRETGRFLQKLTIWILIGVIVLPMTALYGAESINELDLQRDKPTPAKVVKVIEANVYELMVYDSNVPRAEVYALIGVRSNGNQQAYAYSVEKLLNRTVYFLEDSSIPMQDGIRFCYLYEDLSISHNQDLIQKGYALADSDFKTAKDYLKYVRSQNLARENQVGIHNSSDRKKTDRILNINAAGIEQLRQHFGVDEWTASKWYARIASNPINRLGELRALDSEFFTPEVILDYTPSIHLRTNLQYASPYEINSVLGRVTDNSRITDQILEYRLFTEQMTEKDFHKIPISEQYRKLMYPYLTFGNQYYSYSDRHSTVNLNTANEEQMVAALGITTAQGVIIKAFRAKDYPLRNVEELFQPYYPLNKEGKRIDTLSDNITMYTDINSAGESEIRSLFGSMSMTNAQRTTLVQSILKNRPFAGYPALEAIITAKYASAVKDFIYFDSLPSTNLINVNTAGKDKIVNALGLSQTKKLQLKERYVSPTELPEFLLENKDRITLYTNINRAGLEELSNLAPEMTTALAKDILKERASGDYYSLTDVQKIFKAHNMEALFHRIKPYLILQ